MHRPANSKVSAGRPSRGPDDVIGPREGSSVPPTGLPDQLNSALGPRPRGQGLERSVEPISDPTPTEVGSVPPPAVSGRGLVPDRRLL